MGVRPGDILEGKYRIDTVLGRGGMGTVYGGEHVKIHRRVAIKVLKPTLSQEPGMVERFEREALAASKVRSPHVVEVFDVGQLESGEPYIIMERLDGESLSQRIGRERRLTPADAFSMASQLLAGLSAAHLQGIVHRDLKPPNVHIGADGTVKVLDFGISKFAEIVPSEDGATTSGAIVGTPHYMAPEQTKGSRFVDHRADIYAVGAILFRAITGRFPVEAETIHELIARLLYESAKTVRTYAPSFDERGAAIIDRSLRRDPAERFQSAADMKAAIDDWLAHDGARQTQVLPVPDLGAPAPEPVRSVEPTPASTGPGSITPSPNTMGTHVPVPARPMVGPVVAFAVLTIAGITAVALFMSRHETDPRPVAAPPSATAPRRDVAATPASSTSSSATPAAPSATSTSEPSTRASASAAPDRSAEKRPPRPAPAAPSGRDYRTDI